MSCVDKCRWGVGGGWWMSWGWDCVSINSIQSYRNRVVVPPLCTSTGSI